MNVRQLVALLTAVDQDLPVVVLNEDGVEDLPFVDDGPIIEILKGDAGRPFVAINVRLEE